MLSRRDELLIGVGVTLFAVLLFTVLIPTGVVRPSGAALFLSPRFWPYVLSGVLLFCGALLTARAILMPPPPPEQVESLHLTLPELQRLGALLLLLAAVYLAIPVLGLTWSAMGAFVGTMLIGSREKPLAGLLVGLLLPLLLYAFFTKLAGVPIPQGIFVRLP